MKSKSGMMCITSYAVTRHYGGPEEGGWWFDWHTPIKTVYVPSRWTLDRVDRACAMMQARSRKQHAEGDISSVLGGVQVVTYREYSYQEFKSTSRPHYE